METYYKPEDLAEVWRDGKRSPGSAKKFLIITMPCLQKAR